MSATDSDNSIDWLASDNEDDESERESDCAGKRSQTEAPPSHLGPSESSSCRSSKVKEGESNWSEGSEASSRGSPSSCTEAWDRDATELCQTQQGQKSNAKSTLQALKRPHSATVDERKELQYISSESEKDRIFTRKVRTSVTHVCLAQEVDTVSKTRTCSFTHINFPIGCRVCLSHDISSKKTLPYTLRLD